MYICLYICMFITLFFRVLCMYKHRYVRECTYTIALATGGGFVMQKSTLRLQSSFAVTFWTSRARLKDDDNVKTNMCNNPPYNTQNKKSHNLISVQKSTLKTHGNCCRTFQFPKRTRTDTHRYMCVCVYIYICSPHNSRQNELRSSSCTVSPSEPAMLCCGSSGSRGSWKRRSFHRGLI